MGPGSATEAVSFESHPGRQHWQQGVLSTSPSVSGLTRSAPRPYPTLKLCTLLDAAASSLLTARAHSIPDALDGGDVGGDQSPCDQSPCDQSPCPLHTRGTMLAPGIPGEKSIAYV